MLRMKLHEFRIFLRASPETRRALQEQSRMGAIVTDAATERILRSAYKVYLKTKLPLASNQFSAVYSDEELEFALTSGQYPKGYAVLIGSLIHKYMPSLGGFAPTVFHDHDLYKGCVNLLRSEGRVCTDVIEALRRIGIERK